MGVLIVYSCDGLGFTGTQFVSNEEYKKGIKFHIKNIQIIGVIKLKKFKHPEPPSKKNKAFDFESFRSVYKNAYKSWSTQSDMKLITLFGNFRGTPEEFCIWATLKFYRTPGSIRSRLIHLNLTK